MTFLGLSLGLTRTRPLLAVEESAAALTFTALSPRGDVRGRVQVARSGDLARDLGSGQVALREAGLRPPRSAVFVTDQATTACLELPAVSEVSADEVAGMVRFELEPLLPAPAIGGLACGWAAAQANGAPGGGGPLLACGLPADARDGLAQAFRRAGMRLEGVYGRGSCAAALLPSLDDVTVVELQPGSVGAARVRGGRVTQLQHTQADGALETAQAALELVEPGTPLVVVGPASPELIEQLQALHEDTRHMLSEPGTAPSVLGAALHALGQPGGERVAGVQGRTPRPLRSRGGVQVAAGLLVLAGVVLGLDLLTQVQLRVASDARAQLEGEVRGRRGKVEAIRQLNERHDALAAEITALEAEHAQARSGAERGAELVALVDALASTAPGGLILERLEDGGHAVVLTGTCGSPSGVQVFLDQLAAALGDRELRVALRRVTRDEASLRPSYRFEARLQGGAE